MYGTRPRPKGKTGNMAHHGTNRSDLVDLSEGADE